MPTFKRIQLVSLLKNLGTDGKIHLGEMWKSKKNDVPALSSQYHLTPHQISGFQATQYATNKSYFPNTAHMFPLSRKVKVK